MRKTLTKPFMLAASLAMALFQPAAFGGPESLPDHSKDKVQMIEQAPICDPRWYISLGGSVDFQLGEFSNGVSEIGPGGVNIEIESYDWDEVYDIAWNIQGEFGYALTNHIELFANFRFTQASSDSVRETALIFPGLFDVDFVAEFDDYKSWGGEIGLRYYFFGKQARFRPYVAISGGASCVDDIDLRLETADFPLGDDFTFYDGDFYDSTLVGTAAAVLGVEFAVVPCKFFIGADVGVRWQSELDGDDSDFDDFTNGETDGVLGGNGNGGSGFQQAVISLLDPLNDSDSNHFTIPVSVYAKFRF
jgi:hypothetical protein